MYVLGANRSIVALDAATGKEIWTHRNEGAVGDRGMNYWESKDRSERRLLYMNGGFLTAIDARTGNTIASFGDNGKVDVRVGLHRDVTEHPAAADRQSRTDLREPDHHVAARRRRGVRLQPRRHARLRRAHRRAQVGVPQRAGEGRVRRRHLARERAGVRRRRPQLERAQRRRDSAASSTSRSARRGSTSTAATATATTCSATAWSRSTRAPASGCGTTSSSTTICGTTISRRRRSC